MLEIQKNVYDEMVAHARAESPIEACGYLGAVNGKAVTAYPMTNTDKSGEHFSFDPKEQFDVVRKARDKGETASVVYHSHPETPSRPSDEDIRLAFDPNVSYVIVSLAGDEPVVKSFLIRQGEVEIEEIVVVEDAAAYQGRP